MVLKKKSSLFYTTFGQPREIYAGLRAVTATPDPPDAPCIPQTLRALVLVCLHPCGRARARMLTRTAAIKSSMGESEKIKPVKIA
jgi:hypothetical protein